MWRISQWILVWTRRTRVGWEEERKKAAANEKEAAEMGRGCRRWGGVGGENNGFPILHPTLCSLRGGKRVF